MSTTTSTPDLTSILATLAKSQEIIMERLDKLEKSAPTAPAAPVEATKVPSVLDGLPVGVTLSDVKAYAKSKGQNITGKVTPERVAQWTALYVADHPATAVSVQASSSADNPWGEFVQSRPSAERQYGRPRAAEATDMYRAHPERPIVESLTSEKLFAFSQAGKPTAKIADFRRVPLNGNHRRCIGLLARGVNTDSVKLVVADAVAIARSTGLGRYF